jgi:hypothetical protein
VSGSARFARTSIPDEPDVAYEGSGLEDLLIIFISTEPIAANIGA